MLAGSNQVGRALRVRLVVGLGRVVEGLEAIKLQARERRKGLHGKALAHRVIEQRLERLDAFDVMVEPEVLRGTTCLGCSLEHGREIVVDFVDTSRGRRSFTATQRPGCRVRAAFLGYSESQSESTYRQRTVKLPSFW